MSYITNEELSMVGLVSEVLETVKFGHPMIRVVEYASGEPVNLPLRHVDMGHRFRDALPSVRAKNVVKAMLWLKSPKQKQKKLRVSKDAMGIAKEALEWSVDNRAGVARARVTKRVF